MSKFNLVEKQHLRQGPGHCFLCKNGNVTHLIDTGEWDSFAGAYYICVHCASEIGKLAQGTGPQLDPMLLSSVGDIVENLATIKDMYDGTFRNIERHISGIASGFATYERLLDEGAKTSLARTLAEFERRDQHIAELEQELTERTVYITELQQQLAERSTREAPRADTDTSVSTSSEKLGASSKSNAPIELGI